jgi:predicted alpha/beta hydrolase
MNMKPDPMPIEEISVRFPASDGYMLGGRFYAGASHQDARRAIVVNCGAGIAAARYCNFARHLASAGFPVLLYDYRGIGWSRPANLRGLAAGVEDWSQFDSGGAIAWLRERCPDSELLGLAHSVGAMLFGGALNVEQLSGYVFVGPHTGYWGDYRRRYRWPMAALWHGVMPLLTMTMGYFPARRLRLGEDIPAGVALQWAARRTAEIQPHAARTGTNTGRAAEMVASYSRLRGPALVLSATDDAFATERAVQRLLGLFPGVTGREVRISPGDAGVSRLGHFGFFRSVPGSALWPRLAACLSDTGMRWPAAEPA